ncbi:hypothetical protein RJ639_007805 [Escallonia herrerae]|uniref:DUF3700 domain-containing protein n=1 Tax=Escallonia herrerae TaxID=1293975 RepID=A0AA88VY03_9ASTE|nr:hypothetical protein RJ639_007805 [Escallonia herrerae]
MLAVFESVIGRPPKELGHGSGSLNTREEIAEVFRSWRPNSSLYHLPNGNFLAVSDEDESLTKSRSLLVMDDVFCIFSGILNNICDLRRHYGLSRLATEAMVVVEAYRVLRDRAPYPPDQVIRDLDGKFAFILFDARASNLFLARDREGSVQLHWGMAGDGSLVCSDDPKIIAEACGKCYTPFPPGCIFLSGNGLISFDHPLHKVKAILREDDEGKVSAVIFQADLYTKLRSIPRTGSAANWADVAVMEGE